MKQCNLTKGLVVFLTVMITLFCGVVPGSWAKDEVVPKCNYCEDQKFKGCYGFMHDGMMITSDTGQLPVPMASVGIFYLDGKGNLTGHEMVRFGTTTFHAEISGTYDVKSDCTGTVVVCATPMTSEGDLIPDFDPLESTISFVTTSKGKELQMVTTNMRPCRNFLTGDIEPINSIEPINIVGIAKKQNCKH